MTIPSDHSLPILVVDDDVDAAEGIAELLSLSGYEARAATGGAQALELAQQERPACVLLDVRMPEMDGVELARRLRERYNGEVTLIAMTGLDQSHEQHADIMKLVDYFLPKPVEFARLMKILAPQGR